MNALNKYGLGFALSLTLSLTTVHAFAAQQLDRIVAVVNDDIVLQTDVNLRLSQIQQQLAQNNTQVPSLDVLTSQVLDQLVIENLQLQLAQAQGVHIAAASLDQALERIAKSNQLSLAQLQQAVTNSGDTMAHFRDKIRQEMTINEVQTSSVNKRIRVSEHEVDRYLASNQGQALAETEYEIGHILVNLSTTPDAQELAAAQAKLDLITAQLAQGNDFSSLAVSHSDALNALEGGNLGWRKGSQLPSLFAEPISDMQAGDVSQPIRNSNGFHLIKLINKRGVSVQTIAQTKANHLLILPNEIRTATQAQELINELHQRIINGADFYDLARTFSDDANSAPSGGDLGWVNHDQLPQLLQSELEKLALGELSLPIQSYSGWHLLQAIERRTKDVGQANLRYQAKQTIRQSKFAGELENWLREIRNQAYIEIR
ncbi:MAG: molecular chaperone SurA [Oceanospirillaceae bacterium]|nr:molecular chaperone SurA [Oceanospirillaceae bacterium]